ncbi:MAG: aminopeptidase, partial [Planctomycetes bacterium]|nr:aminopeptidase [Planctomycetota bacterium]
MLATDATITSSAWEDFAGGYHYVYAERVSILDGSSTSDGVFSYHLVAWDNSLSLQTHWYGYFQVINSTLDALLDSAGLAAVDAQAIRDTLELWDTRIDSMEAALADANINAKVWVDGAGVKRDAIIDSINAILDTDEGARYVGEFAIGFNPYILDPMKDILFDEKIAGSLHFTPGRAYEDANNGNVSEIHWDLVLIQRPEYGGGIIRFDDEVVRQDGQFVSADLVGLNPEALKR